MKISKSLLHKAVVFGAGLVDNKADGVYSYLKIHVKEKRAAIHGVGTLASTVINFGVDDSGELEFICQASVLDDIIASIDSEFVDIQTGDNLYFNGQKIEIQAPIENALFPRALESTDSPRKIFHRFDVKQFADRLRFVAKASFEGPSDSITSNIYVSNGEIRACDNTIFFATPFNLQSTLIIPRNNANIIYGFAELVPFADVLETEEFIIFSGESGVLTLVKGRAQPLPTFANMLSKWNLQSELFLSKDTLLLALKRALVTNDPKRPEAKFITYGSVLRIVSQFKGYQMVQSVADTTATINMMMNPKHVMTFLSAVASEFIEIKSGGPLDPIYLSAGDQKALIMPVSET